MTEHPNYNPFTTNFKKKSNEEWIITRKAYDQIL